MNLKLLLKRGALMAAANWPTVVIQFIAETAFQVLVGIPILGAAVLVAVVVGTDLTDLLQGGLRDIATRIATALTSEPVALGSFAVAFSLALGAASVLMFLVKGGVLDVLLVAHESAGSFEREPISIDTIEPAACFTLDRFMNGCARLFRPYVGLGVMLLVAYALTAAAYVAFAVYGYRAASGVLGVVGLAFLAAVAAVVLIIWITIVNFVYLLMQIAIAADNLRFNDAFRAVIAFLRTEFVTLAQIFLVILGVEIGATLVSALAWSGLGLIAFVPLVGLAVIPLQLVALAVRGLAFAYIGLTAASAYLTLYRREPRVVAQSSRAVMAQTLGPPESGSVTG
ncbi:MAG TPA: hypothetical protein VLV86_01980 [Vicinamibacterales bacterium]|nr:hypothetical protein [Vicinamibacterales bacterium]